MRSTTTTRAPAASIASVLASPMPDAPPVTGIDEQGVILDAKIVPPTSQNQKTIERDLWKFVPKYLDLPQDKLTWQCEQAIRNYDPCISCATHFLKLKIERD